MLTSLSGTLSTVGLDWVEIAVGGVGLRVNVPASLIDQVGKVGDGVKLYTSLQVKEDSLTLYGFPSADGRQAFEALLGVNGVGPRLALSILSRMAPENLALAVATEDPSEFKGVSGVGTRIAQRIVMELKGKLEIEMTAAPYSATGCRAYRSPHGIRLHHVRSFGSRRKSPARQTAEVRGQTATRP